MKYELRLQLIVAEVSARRKNTPCPFGFAQGLEHCRNGSRLTLQRAERITLSKHVPAGASKPSGRIFHEFLMKYPG